MSYIQASNIIVQILTLNVAEKLPLYGLYVYYVVHTYLRLWQVKSYTSMGFSGNTMRCLIQVPAKCWCSYGFIFLYGSDRGGIRITGKPLLLFNHISSKTLCFIHTGVSMDSMRGFIISIFFPHCNLIRTNTAFSSSLSPQKSKRIKGNTPPVALDVRSHGRRLNATVTTQDVRLSPALKLGGFSVKRDQDGKGEGAIHHQRAGYVVFKQARADRDPPDSPSPAPCVITT